MHCGSFKSYWEKELESEQFLPIIRQIYITLRPYFILFVPSPRKVLDEIIRRFTQFGLILQLQNVKSTHGGVLLLVNLTASACYFIKSNTSRRVFVKLYKKYQIAQSITTE